MKKKNFSFKVIKNFKKARLGKIITLRGAIDTPAFMPVGTLGSVKGLFVDDLKKTGSQIILGNTYHLMLRPGTQTLDRFDGLHGFMNWHKPILTDSGGFQIMSLSKLNKIDRDVGAIFQSHIDGKKIILSPEKSIKIQKSINSDILMVLDECPKLTKDRDILINAMETSNNWAKRCKIEFGNIKQKGLFGIIQGGLFKDLRLESLQKLTEINFDGYAIGGLAVGETQSEMFETVKYITSFMPVNKPRYLMGVGTPSDILGAVKEGVDMFDCVMPTRSGRTGLAFTWNGRINIRNSKYQNDNEPIDANCTNLNLNKYSKNYLNHLFNTNEILASMILTLHNINFYQELMTAIRDNIEKGTFDDFHDLYINKL